MLCSWVAPYFLFRWGGGSWHHITYSSHLNWNLQQLAATPLSPTQPDTLEKLSLILTLIWIITILKKCMPVIANFFPQENWHYKWHKSWYILLCHPLRYTWFIISQKLQVSLKSFLSGCCDLTLELLLESALAVYPSGLWLTGSSCVHKKITLIRRRTLTLVIYIFALRSAFTSKKTLLPCN